MVQDVSRSNKADSESIADEFTIRLHSDKRGSTNHVKTAVREGLDPSSSLAELEDNTTVDDSLEHMSQSRFSELTNDRDYRAVGQLPVEVLHTTVVSSTRGSTKTVGVDGTGVVAVDATSLELTRSVSVVVSDEFVGDDDDVSKIDTDDGGLELHCAVRVDGENKHSLDATVTEGNSYESPQFDFLREDIEVFADLDSVVWVRDVHTRDICGSVISKTVTMILSHWCIRTLDLSSVRHSKSSRLRSLGTMPLSRPTQMENQHDGYGFVMNELSELRLAKSSAGLCLKRPIEKRLST